MGSMTDASITAWQRVAGVTPATGARAELLERLSQAALQLIKIKSWNDQVFAKATGGGTVVMWWSTQRMISPNCMLG
jgi:hypothetical protein